MLLGQNLGGAWQGNTRNGWDCSGVNRKVGGNSPFVILILQTFPLTSKSTLKGQILLASILVTT